MKITLHNHSITIRATDYFMLRNGSTEYVDDLMVDSKAAEFGRALETGAIHTLVSHERVAGDTGLLSVRLASADGAPSNSGDPSQRATEGWRGTTNDVAVYAHGLVRITDVRRLARGYGYRVAFKRVADDS